MSITQFSVMTPTQAAHFMSNAPKQAVRTRLAQLVDGRVVLDIGCGKAEEVELYHPEQYLGVDCSPELIRLAQAQHPGYAFGATDVLALRGFWPCAIIKSVLEHLPEDEAVAVYEHARSLTRELYVVWHTPPSEHPQRRQYLGELGVMEQNVHPRSRFAGVRMVEVCAPHVIWTVEGTGS